jgi:transcription antitermination factor NusG
VQGQDRSSAISFIKSDGVRRWYAVQTASGHENKVKEHIEKRIVTMGAQDKIFGVIVPEKMVTKVKDGKRLEKKEREYPGYVFVEMILDDDSWRVVREAPGVTKYVGAGKKPIPVQDAEIRKILRRQMAVTCVSPADRSPTLQAKLLKSTWNVSVSRRPSSSSVAPPQLN